MASSTKSISNDIGFSCFIFRRESEGLQEFYPFDMPSVKFLLPIDVLKRFMV